ncbi:MAG TPA: SLC13 family permease [Verrucomicrobiae bacterium]|nr:SLC13 family permease [Verrucomicrobiae bacterium]
MSSFLVYAIAAAAIGGIFFRPRQWPEAVWACAGAVLLIALRLVSVGAAMAAIGEGRDVYLFLAGMMMLAELARRAGVFDWLAAIAAAHARHSRARLFLLVYVVGTVVTVLLSNDATAVVLTPAVYAAVKRARATPLPYLLICAFIANAASFVLPISNPANLVVYGAALPPLLTWLRNFALPSALSIGATFAILRLLTARELRGSFEDDAPPPRLTREGRRAAWGIGLAGVLLVGVSLAGRDLGPPIFAAALMVAICVTWRIRGEFLGTLRGIAWSVLPLVAGLFVLVAALEAQGAAHLVRMAFDRAGPLGASFGIAGLSNVMNNLPSGLLTRAALREAPVTGHLLAALVIGVDLGPNLSVTGSLATILWLIALRREGESVSAWGFLKYGMLVMPPALLLATLAARV